MKLQLNLSQIYSDTSRPGTSRHSSVQAVNKRNIRPEIVQECLDSLDIFRDLLEGIPHQKNRVVRDVCKTIELQKYPKDTVIYDVGDTATAVFLCLSGKVSFGIIQLKPISDDEKKQRLPTEPQTEQVFSEVDLLEEGQGFGEAEFIMSTKRALRAVSAGESIIGKLELQSFSQVLQSYKQRVYYKKRDMFERCALFKNLHPKKLDFIINNTKPHTLNISEKLVSQGDPLQYIYLVNKGQVSLWKKVEPEDDEIGRSRMMSPRKILRGSIDLQVRLKKKIFMGLIDEGGFIGDMELVLGRNHESNVVATTSKAQIYSCNKKIVMSQLEEKNWKEAETYYRQKEQYNGVKVKKFNEAEISIEKKKEADWLPKLTSDQIKLKKIINHRYCEKKESLIGSSSPRDIEKMINRKAARIKTVGNEDSGEPTLEIFPSHSQKKRSYTPSAFNPISIVESPEKRFITERNVSRTDKEEDEKPQIMKSMMIKIKKSKLSMNTVRQGRSEHMAGVNSILNSRKNTSRREIEKIIQRIHKYSKG